LMLVRDFVWLSCAPAATGSTSATIAAAVTNLMGCSSFTLDVHDTFRRRLWLGL